MSPSIFLSFTKLKTFVSAASAISLSSLGIHYGIVSPANNSRRSKWIEGSSPELRRERGNPYDSSSTSHYFVEEFGKKTKIPPIRKILRASDLVVDEKTGKSTRISKLGFSPEITKALEATTINAIKIPNNDIWRSNSYILINSESLINYTTNFLTSYSFLSEIEFPYKSYFYMNLINGMMKNDFIHDLIWSLAEESEFKKMFVRPESIKINFDLEETDGILNKPIDAYPKYARKLNNFNFTFRIINPNPKPETIFRKIPLDPNSESEVNIKVQNSEIRPFSVPVRGIRWKAANWDLLPTRGTNFTITVNNHFPRKESRFMLEEKLNLIHGRSKFFDYLISTVTKKGDLEASRALNSPTFRDFKKIASPMLASITSEQIKKDIETWYGAMFSQWLKIQFYDIEKLIGMIKAKIFLNERGKTVSFIDQFINNNNFRENFYSHVNFKRGIKNVLNGFFDEKIAEHQIKVEEVVAVLTNTMNNVKKIKDKFKVTFEWLEEPKLEHSLGYDDDIYPSVSLSFKQKIELLEDFSIDFKGKTNVDGKEVSFDFSQKLQALKEILLPMKKDLGETFKLNVFNINIFDALIPDAKNYVGWEKFEIKKEQIVEATFRAYKSPIRPAVEANSNFHDQMNGNVVFGWKLLDVSASYDLSKFSDFFAQFYKKIDDQKEKAQLGITDLTTIAFDYKNYIQEKLKDKPITEVLKHINYIFPSEKDSESFWRTFFRVLLERHITLNSTQLFVGYSRAYFNVKDDFIDEFRELDEKDNKKMIFQTKKKISNKSYDITHEDYRFPATPKSPLLKKIIESFHLYYSTFFPNPPIIFKSPYESKEFVEFLNKEASSSIGLINNSHKLKNILKKHYQVGTREYLNKNTSEIIRSFDKESFPIDGSIDWSKVKISFYQFQLPQSLNTILAKNINATVTSTIGFLISKPLSSIAIELIQRDLFLVNVNLMMEDGSLELFDRPNESSKRNSHSVHNFKIDPRFDPKKIK